MMYVNVKMMMMMMMMMMMCVIYFYLKLTSFFSGPLSIAKKSIYRSLGLTWSPTMFILDILVHHDMVYFSKQN